MDPTRLILVGGFLGAGKTSLLMSAAELLKKRGIPVGLVTNDQAEGLVDTAYLEEIPSPKSAEAASAVISRGFLTR